MAQVNINIDTVNKTVEVSVDGEMLDDVKYVSVYPPSDYDSFWLSIERVSKLENGLKQRVSLTASKNTDLQEDVKPVVSKEMLAIIARDKK